MTSVQEAIIRSAKFKSSLAVHFPPQLRLEAMEQFCENPRNL
jgi:hypothetical protein